MNLRRSTRGIFWLLGLFAAVTACTTGDPVPSPQPATASATAADETPNSEFIDAGDGAADVDDEVDGDQTDEPDADEPVITTIGIPENELTVGGVVLRGGESTRHAHGGEPAQVGHVRLRIATDDETHRLELTQVELLKRHCRSEDWDDAYVQEREPVEFYLVKPDADPERVASELTIDGPAEDLEWWIHFQPLSVYQTCNQFTFRLTLTVDGEETTFLVPLLVIRFEP